MKELLIEAIKEWGYKIEDIDKETLSISNDSWVGDEIIAVLDDESRMIRFYNPEFCEESRWDVEGVTDLFAAINVVNKVGRVRAYYRPTEDDTFTVSASASLPYTDDKKIILVEIHGIFCNLILAHKMLDPEYADKFDKSSDEEYDKLMLEGDEGSTGSPITEEEMTAKDNKLKIDLICETLKEMQCVPDLSEMDEGLVLFEYQGNTYRICIDGGPENVVLFPGCLETFDANNIEKFSLVRKLINYMNSEHDVALVNLRDEDDKKLYNIFSIAILRCVEKEYFKENLLRLINDYIVISMQFFIALGIFTHAKEMKENYMLNYDL